MKSNRSILKKSTAILALALVLAVLFPLQACAKETMLEPIGITMTTKASEVKIYVAGSKDVVIDWGDGKKSNLDEGTSLTHTELLEFSHSYSGTTVHNIVITGDVTMLTCRNNQLTTVMLII